MAFQKLSKALISLKEKLNDVKNKLISKRELDLLNLENNQTPVKINFPLSGNSDSQVSFVLPKNQITCDDQDKTEDCLNNGQALEKEKDFKIKKLVSLVFEAPFQNNDSYFCEIAEIIFYTFLGP